MFTKLVRLGRDAELRVTPQGTSVCSFAAAYDIGYGDKKRPQWVECTIWGERGEKVVSHLTKGTQVVVTLDEVEVEQWESNGKAGAKLKGRVVSFDFAGSNQQAPQAPQAPQRQQAPQQAPQAPQQPQQPAPSKGFDDFDDDIPF